MRTARRQWIRSADTDGAFFLDTSVYAQQLGLLPAPSTHAGNGVLHPDDAAQNGSLHAGLSDVAAAVAANGASSNGSSHNGVLAGLGSPERLAAALSSADAEMQAHIAAQSLAVNMQNGSHNGAVASSKAGSRAKTPEQEQKELMKFVRDFELVPIPAEDMLWGLQGDAAVHR